ncbi:MAG: serine hydrolase [Lachnospiraceae bacterium]
MKYAFKSLISILATLLLVFSLNGTALAAPLYETVSPDTEDDAASGTPEDESPLLDESGWPIPPEIDCGSAVMLEVNTEAVLFSKSPDRRRYPASITKLLTCLLALENCSLNETVTFSQAAVDIEEGASNIGAVAGEEMSMKDVLYALMLPSGNECANAVAEHVAGSVENFAEMMNARAAELGCTDSHFTNPHGLYDENHYSTAADIAIIAKTAFNNSAFCEIISHSSYTISPTNKSDARTVENTHAMIIPNSSYYYDAVVGGKTGYLPESGRCLVTLAKQNGLTLVVVCLFSPTYSGVFPDTQELLDYAFNGFSLNNISESETRFSFSCEESKIVLDSTTQVLLPSSLTTDDLDSSIAFTYEMDRKEFDKASAEAGILTRDGRHLYAVIDYSYRGNYLGHINVLIDDNLEITQSAFVNIHYLNVWHFVAGGGFVIFFVAVVSIARRIRASSNKIKRRRPRVTNYSGR